MVLESICTCPTIYPYDDDRFDDSLPVSILALDLLLLRGEQHRVMHSFQSFRINHVYDEFAATVRYRRKLFPLNLFKKRGNFKLKLQRNPSEIMSATMWVRGCDKKNSSTTIIKRSAKNNGGRRVFPLSCKVDCF